ncbi:MAG TPA: 30S ribosomal protein S12 methylthiotransferase RimO [Patescibacteria group bacterium]|nr:30S ribosomal protein S12 methylthiotransferase RimO [Patescibacteria group bacterium]
MNVSPERPLRVGLISLGCAKNLVDSEVMVGTLLKDGVQITNEPEQADVLIVNTCSFIDSAQEESVDAILESDQLRRVRNERQGLIVAGCLPQRFREELPRLLPEVDAFMGIDQVADVTRIVRQSLSARAAKLAVRSSSPARAKKKTVIGRLSQLEAKQPQHAEHSHSADASTSGSKTSAPLISVNARPRYIPDYATPRFRLTPRHFAYVKIAEGCNHPCSFCIIPRMRGSHRSRIQSDIVAEARALLADGVKELNLISQDSTYYGLDLRQNHSRAIAAPDRFTAAVNSLPENASTISTLLRELNSLPGEFWIRLLYTHPAHWTDELIRTIADCPKVARYVDMPLQHIHQNMLERMRRETSQQYIVDLINNIRARVPGIALRTTFIVGFPGETQEYFETLLEFIQSARFERLGVFTFSQEEGTRAGKMGGQIPDKIKKQRRDRAMAVQHDVAVRVAESFMGRTIKVLVEGEASAKELKSARISSWEHGLIRARDTDVTQLRGRYLVARGEADAPDIDGRVYVRGDLPRGQFAQVKIVGHTDYDLIAQPQ